MGTTIAETSLIWRGCEENLNVPYDSNSSFIPLVVLSICDLRVVMFDPTSLKCWTLLNLQSFRNVHTKSFWGTIDNLITSPYKKRTKTTNINSSRSQVFRIFTIRRHDNIYICRSPIDKTTSGMKLELESWAIQALSMRRHGMRKFKDHFFVRHCKPQSTRKYYQDRNKPGTEFPQSSTQTGPWHSSSHRNVDRPLSVKTKPTGLLKPMSIPHFPFSAHAISVSIDVSKVSFKNGINISRIKKFHNSCRTEIRINKTCHSWKYILKNFVTKFHLQEYNEWRNSYKPFFHLSVALSKVSQIPDVGGTVQLSIQQILFEFWSNFHVSPWVYEL